jgi:o-succinylbenzoate synthase
VKIAGAQLSAYRLPLKNPLATAHGSIQEREGLLLTLTTDTGARGFGESAPLPGFGMESLARSRAALGDLARDLIGASVADLHADLHASSGSRMGVPHDCPGAQAALDCALSDLAAQAAGQSLADWLAGRLRGESAATLSINAVLQGEGDDALRHSLKEARALGYSTFKLKVAARPVADDITQVRALRVHLREGEWLRLDANGGWCEADASRALDEIGPESIEYVEQPVAVHDEAGMARLAKRGIPLAIDESASSVAAVAHLLACAAIRVVVVKPAALGGLGVALAIIETALAQDVDVVVTSMIDSAVGVAMAAGLAAALPEQRYAHGLGTGALLASDLAPPLVPKQGTLTLSGAGGLGVVPNLDRCSTISNSSPGIRA